MQICVCLNFWHMQTDTVTVREAAEILGVDTSTVQRWIGDRLHCVAEIGGTKRPALRLLSRDDVYALRDERTAS